MWKNVTPAPEDAILGLTEAFQKDPCPKKVNLGAGVYKNNDGLTPVLRCIKIAERQLIESETSKGYLAIGGDPIYAAHVQHLLFGKGSAIIDSGRAMTVHTPGGTGGLRVGADLLKKFKPNATVWVSTPTWANHKGIFTSSGFAVGDYPYYNPTTRALDFEALCAKLETIPSTDIVLLHVCCHNPTGVDPSPEQWDRIVAIAKKQGWLPFLDFAYQGFGTNLKDDRLAVDKFSDSQINFLVTSSFSKNMGLYNERTGALTVVSLSAEEEAVAMSHLKATIRVCYSNPPAHGGLVAGIVFDTPELYQMWVDEVAAMRVRLIDMRNALVDGLTARNVPGDFSYIKRQHGMFSFSGLSDEIVAWLRKNKSIYIVSGGRINLASLTSSNLDYVCDSIAEAIETLSQK